MERDSLPLVSVVIPCYRQAHFVGEAIESALRQTHQRCEIVVVDDGSPDDTSEVAARYAVRCIRQENQGLPAARNAGLRATTGDFVVFLDSDDRLLPDAIRIGLDAFRTHPEAAFVCGHNQCIDASGAPSEFHPRACPGVNYTTLLAHNLIYCPASVVYRREMLEAAGGFTTSPAVKAVEDYELYLRTTRTHPVHCHHQLVSEYRRHGTSMSQNNSRMLRSVMSVLRAQKDQLRSAENERAHKAGVAFCRQYYGEGVVNEVREHVRSRSEWGQMLRKIGVLLRYYPRGLGENVGRKLRAKILRWGDGASTATQKRGGHR